MEDLSKRIAELEARLTEKDDKIAKLEAEANSLETNVDDVVSVYPREFYITTAIHYTNGQPHVGHAYENITADVIARYHRIFGRQVFFLTGTDEHGQKIGQTAEALGIQPIELCDKYSKVFQGLTADLNISNDHFIRTTSEPHKEFAQWAFQKAIDAGDIYLGHYEGWYNVREETFVTESEAQKSEYKDPTSGVPLKKMKEESYFFRMSKYQQRLIDHFHQNPNFLLPQVRRQTILQRLEEPLMDLSVSRNTFKHGIPLPNDPEHVMYVWFDALSNYLSGIGYPNGPNAHFWPAGVHIIGKDIVWFHAVIWPCMLMSLGLELPKMIFGHGHVSAGDGRKMSKSLGNVVDPYRVMEKYSLDTFRYFICRETPYGNDMAFSELDLILLHNAELADALGNLVHRAVNLCAKYCDGKVPDVAVDQPFDLATLRLSVERFMKECALQDACIAAMNAIRETNKYLTDQAPWHMKDNDTGRATVVRTTLEAIYIAAHFLSPFVPEACDKIFDKMQTKPKTIFTLSKAFENLKPGTPVSVGEVLFEKYISEDEMKKQEEKQAAKEAAKAAQAAKVNKTTSLFASIDIRVGEITKVWEHPDSDKLFCEEIDIGLDEPKQIASGLRAHYSLAQMQNQKCLVICNLKPAKLGGFKSHGMVLCAVSEDGKTCEFITPPEGSKVGERVFITTESGEPVSAGQMKKQKIWEKVSINLKTSDQRIAMYQDQPLRTEAGECFALSLSNAPIS